MLRFMCFPVAVDAKSGTVTSRPQEGPNGQIYEAESYDAAVEQAGNHIALFEGEQIACVKVGRVLNEAAASKVALGQAGG